MIKLGDKVKDKVTGFTGIAVSKTEYLHGCKRISIASPKLHEGKPVAWQTFDEPQLELVESGVVKVKPEEAFTGGPRPDTPINRSGE